VHWWGCSLALDPDTVCDTTLSVVVQKRPSANNLTGDSQGIYGSQGICDDGDDDDATSQSEGPLLPLPADNGYSYVTLTTEPPALSFRCAAALLALWLLSVGPN
jgi:hypothetical protein